MDKDFLKTGENKLCDECFRITVFFYSTTNTAYCYKCYQMKLWEKNYKNDFATFDEYMINEMEKDEK